MDEATDDPGQQTIARLPRTFFNGTALALSVALSGWAVRLRAERAKTRQLQLLDVQ